MDRNTDSADATGSVDSADLADLTDSADVVDSEFILHLDSLDYF